jgi:acetyltransferase-like isoleucine patch superfamily enzyme
LGYFDKTSVIHFPIHAEPRSNVFIREHVNIAPYVQIWANEKVIIGKNTLIASHVIITTSTHNYHVKPIRATRIDKPITIGEDVWIGSGAIIFPGVTIGNGAVIGAGSLVTKDVEPNSIYYGVPAKKMKDREVDTFLDDQSNSE